MTTEPANTEPPRYTSNATLEQIAERLTSARSVVVLTHTKPDGDAVGSVLALARALDLAGITARPVFAPPVDTRFADLFAPNHAQPALAEDEAFFNAPDYAEADAVAVVDTGAFGQLGPAADFVRARAERTVIIDHHRGGEDAMAHLRHVDTTAAAACQPVAQLAAIIASRAANTTASVRDLPASIASPLYLGLASDTGWFKHPSVTPAVFRLAAELLEAGAEHNALYLASEQSDPPARLELMRRALDSLTLVAHGRAAVMHLTARDFDESGADRTESGGLVDLPKTVSTIEVCAMITEAEPELAKVSMRSKAGHLDIDVNAVAHTWGGGGHKHAAGARIPMPVEQAKREVAKALEHAIAHANASRGNA